MSEILVPVSYGEVLDKITILEIKAERMSDPAKLANVRKELSRLSQTWRGSGLALDSISAEHAALKAVNEKLWDIEDRIRVKEAQATFDNEFIELARAVYFVNDDRARIKREVNTALGSSLVEEKSYASYQRGDDKPTIQG
jgi:hypothetical protein